jgi:RNA polymerase sigma-32 factor
LCCGRTPDHIANPEQQLTSEDWTDKRENALYNALSRLDERSKDIINSRWLAEKKATLHDLAAKYQISAERVRQLEKNAMLKVRESIAIH